MQEKDKEKKIANKQKGKEERQDRRRKPMALPDLAGKVRTPDYDERGYPKCWGTFRRGDECDCPYAHACSLITYGEKADRLEEVKRKYYYEVPLDDSRDISPDETMDKAEFFTTVKKAGETLAVGGSDINLDLICYMVYLALEQPATARAFVMRLRPGVKNLQDIADMLGVSRQAVQKRIAQELGIGKRNYRIDEFTQLSEREFMVYKLCFQDGCSMRSAAKQLGVAEGTVRNTMRDLRNKGFCCASEKNDKNK